MDDISHAHPGLPRCKLCHVPAVRSCDVINGHQNVFLSISSLRKELQHHAWSYCVQLIKPQRMIYILTLRSPLDLDLMRSSYTYLDYYQRDDIDGAIIFALKEWFLVQKLLAKKNSLSSSASILTFLIPVTSFLD